MSRTPQSSSMARVWASMGRPHRGSMGLGVWRVSGRRRVPRPAASMKALRGASTAGGAGGWLFGGGVEAGVVGDVPGRGGRIV